MHAPFTVVIYDKKLILSALLIFIFVACSACAALTGNKDYSDLDEDEFPVAEISALPIFTDWGEIDSIEGVENLSGLPKESMVYAVKPYEYDKSGAEKIADSLFDGEIDPGRTDDSELTLFLNSDKGDYFEIDKITGSYFYYASRWFESSDDIITDRLPDKEYIERSLKFIKDKGIDCDGFDLDKAVVEPVEESKTEDSNGNVTSNPLEIGVFFRNKPLGNVKFEGTRSPLLLFSFDYTNEIVGMSLFQREFTLLKNYPLISNSELLERIKAGKYSCRGNKNGKISVNRAEIVYFNEALNTKQLFLTPVYKLTGRDSSGENAVIYVQALKEEHFKETDEPDSPEKGIGEEEKQRQIDKEIKQE
jgi:hypothetical protein